MIKVDNFKISTGVLSSKIYALSIFTQLFCLNREIPICVVYFKGCNEYVLVSEIATILKLAQVAEPSAEYK